MDRILDATVSFICRNKEDVNEEQVEIIRYGLELFIIKVSFFTAALFIGLLLNSFWECLVFTVLFSSIRTTAGWFHAGTRIQCFIMSMLTYVVVFAILKIVVSCEILLIPLAVLSVVSSIVIWKFAPIDTENKPLDNNEKEFFCKKSRIMIAVEICIAIVMYFTRLISVSCSAMLALIITAMLMLTELMKNKCMNQ